MKLKFPNRTHQETCPSQSAPWPNSKAWHGRSISNGLATTCADAGDPNGGDPNGGDPMRIPAWARSSAGPGSRRSRQSPGDTYSDGGWQKTQTDQPTENGFTVTLLKKKKKTGLVFYDISFTTLKHLDTMRHMMSHPVFFLVPSNIRSK